MYTLKACLWDKTTVSLSLVFSTFFDTWAKEVLLKGEAQYGWPLYTNQFRSAPFYIENIINLFYKTSYLNEEVNCTEPSPLVFTAWTLT